MIKPRGKKILVEMIDAMQTVHNPLGLTLIDQKKHWEHKSRRGRVIAVGPKVREVGLGEVVIMPGSAGRTLDGLDVAYGENYRWLEEREIAAVEERG